MLNVERYYRTLDLEPGATAEEVHQGYLDMTWVWHPDRFTGHPRLQQKAHHKIQELNEAHEQLRSWYPTPQRRTSPPKSNDSAPPPPRYSSSVVDLYKPAVNRTWKPEEQPTAKKSGQSPSVKANKLDDWLD